MIKMSRVCGLGMKVKSRRGEGSGGNMFESHFTGKGES